jgi:hypothetical protein
MKSALTTLGFGPCHHMVEVFQHVDSIPLWVAAGAGRPDWDTIFADYQSVVDYPGCRFWRELSDYYPNAKVIHTVRRRKPRAAAGACALLQHAAGRIR